eukprot:2486181-Pleurochrysis_carterae.AAC.14
MEASIQNEGTTSGSAATDACAPCIAPDTDGTTTDTFADGGEAAGGGEALFRKPKRNKNVRRAAATASAGALEEGADDSTSLVKPSKITKPNPLVQSTVSEKKRVLLQKELAEASDRRIASFDNKVFATNEQDTERDRDAQAQYELAQQQWADGGDVAADGSKIYRGQKAYHQYTNKAEDFTSTMLKGHGPARAPVHYRATSRFDYQPDVCKDFKDTGYCGYGDACKFLHDRSDYKTGWQIERDVSPPLPCTMPISTFCVAAAPELLDSLRLAKFAWVMLSSLLPFALRTFGGHEYCVSFAPGPPCVPSGMRPSARRSTKRLSSRSASWTMRPRKRTTTCRLLVSSAASRGTRPPGLS